MLLLAGRILVAFQLLPNGLRKMHSFADTAAMMGGAPPRIIDGRLFPVQEPLFYFPFPELFLVGSVAFDLVLGLLVIFGFRTRISAALLAAYVLLAATVYHGNFRGPEDIMIYIRIFPFVGGLLLIAVSGPGALSVDARLHGRGVHR